jgi:hypothetical protein
MARKEADRLVCKGCGDVINGRKHGETVWLSIGPMHADCHAKHAQRVQQLIADAQTEGRHSDIENWKTICDECGRWVSAIHHVTEAGRRLCHGCTAIPDRAGYRRPKLVQAADIPL